MSLSLIIDDKSLLLLLTIIILLTINIVINKSYQPLVHPLILSRQSDVSPVRRKGQSSIYRNSNSPIGFDLANQPRKAILSVKDCLEKGIGNDDFQFERKRSIYGKDFSNQDLLIQSKKFGKGIGNLIGFKDDISSLAVGVCVEVDSVYSLMITLSGDSQENSVKDRFSPMVIAPVYIKKGKTPSELPISLQKKGAVSLHAIFTTIVALKKAMELNIVGKETIFIFESEKEKEEASKIIQNKVYTFEDVIQQVSDTNAEKLTDSTSKPEKAIHSIFWSGEKGWIEASNSSLIAGLTANLSFYSSDSQPSKNDHIFIEQSPFVESPSLRLAAASTPAGLCLSLLAIYTGSSITASTISSTRNDPNSSPSEEFYKTSPTLIYSSASGASDLASCLCSVSKRSPFASLAVHTKLSTLRNGTFSKNGIWDSILFNSTRKSIGCEHVRSLIILSEGPNVGQGLLDILRSQLGCSVRLAYLPSNPLEVYDNSVNSGVNGKGRSSSSPQSVLVTAPITITHSLDLQAFASNIYNGKQVPAQVGPPNCAIELKLVETEFAINKGMKISGLNEDIDPGRAQDPFGEIFIRGHSLTNIEQGQDKWCSTGDLGTIRSNGTLIVLSDQANSIEVDIPTLSSEYPSSRRSSRIGAGGHPTRTLPLLSILALFVFVLADQSQAQSIYHLTQRSVSSSPNTTFVNAAISSFLSTPRAPWEQGVAQSAMLEYFAGSWSVFSGTKKPNYLLETSNIPELPGFIQMMAFASVKSQDSNGQLCSIITGNEVENEGSALDPAACGEAVLLSGYANGQISFDGQIDENSFFGQAASKQLNYLLNETPKMANGAISMRNVGQSYWSDGVYMAPPFIALYGLITRNQTLLQIAYDQVRLYRDALRIDSGSAENLFKHIVNATGNSGNDNGAWLTGNGWSSAGMVRVLASIAQSDFASEMSTQMNDLVGWIEEIITAALNAGTPMIHNYVNDSSTFQDAGGSSMIAYSTYRLATISRNSSLSTQIQQSENIYNDIQSKLDSNGQLLEGYTVPNPLTFTQPSQGSPESMAFMVLMASARRDYIERNVTGLNGPGGINSASSIALNFASSFYYMLIISLISTLFCLLI